MAGDEIVHSHLDESSEVFTSAVTPGELFFGAAKSGRPVENAARLARLAESITVLVCDVDVAREYGRLKQRLRAKGRPIPENDIWIAAIALRHGLALVTRDHHFSEVDGLTTANWSV